MDTKGKVALSTLSTTEVCAPKVRESLEELGNQVVTFHAVGSGGEAMEERIEQGKAALRRGIPFSAGRLT
ncbi:MAG TPA: Tm-1-like ATP-binding domain-containing protein [Desulfatiglandales bacterium]|nr:Tm-1-like ATP-binding domain-containing protein [Desulfatiglandales bacterium]